MWLFGSQIDGCQTAEITIAKAVIPNLREDMPCLADQHLFGFELSQLARRTGAAAHRPTAIRWTGDQANRGQGEVR
jgi:hypothetical protein